jgi:hypothetical protein
MKMQPHKPVHMEAGPALTPSSALLVWLNANPRKKSGDRRRIRLPVVVEFEDDYRLAYGPIYIAARLEQPANPILLEIDDTALGVGLMTRLLSICPKDKKGCVLWLEGHWGALVDFENEDEEGLPFSVLQVGAIIDQPEQVTTIFAEAE